MVRVGPANHAGLSNREHTGVNWRIRLIRARRRCGRMSNYFDRLFITLCVICTARIVCGAFLCNGTASVRLSVCLSVSLLVLPRARSSKSAAAGLLLWARRAGNIDRLPHGRRSAAAVCGGRMRAVPRCQRTQEAEHRLVTVRYCALTHRASVNNLRIVLMMPLPLCLSGRENAINVKIIYNRHQLRCCRS